MTDPYGGMAAKADTPSLNLQLLSRAKGSGDGYSGYC